MEQKRLTGNEVRAMFLEFFKERGHMVEPGASLIPHNDPTLLWINAGVAALKKYFDGTMKPKSNRICNAQKSIRTNDIENVGKTARHHTFFEMLGNFSIGDYFKHEAIPWAWEFLTSPDWIGFDKNRLYVTVYPDDKDAYDCWIKCGVDPSHICKKEDNFWEIGEGPGGPDTEIFYDRGEKYDPEGLGERAFFEDIENDRYIEVWNVVFSQYDCKPGIVPRTEYKELPHKNIDTGMGLERLVCLIQDGETNFDTDLFLPIIRATEQYTSKKYEGENKMAYRVIADHIRTVTFAISDGAMFGNTGRGYILRRVLRRAVRYGKKLGIEGAFMYKLVPVVAENMKDFYPYLLEKVELVSKLVKSEEESFHATLQEGERILQGYLANCEGKVLPGEDAFKLYDTYGFPYELTVEIAEEAGITVDRTGFDEEMKKQKERARNARGNVQSMASQSKDLMDFDAESTFIGYTDTTCEAEVIGLFQNGEAVDELVGTGEIAFDKTPFYAESGGQIADTGTISNGDVTLTVKDVKKAPHGQFLHRVDTEEGIRKGDVFRLEIDEKRRTLIRANHSSLHLLQAALREVLGNHVAQAGSYCGDEYGRFDFTHFEKPTEAQLHKVEELVNRYVSRHDAVVTQVLSMEDAKKTGAIALFDEKYGDTVRVVSMGEESKEFCGGTHVSNTGEIGLFVIESEESIGSGIRRITSRTGYKAYEFLKHDQDSLNELAKDYGLTSRTGIKKKSDQILSELQEEKKENARLKAQLSEAKAASLLEKAQTVSGKQYLFAELKNDTTTDLKELSLDLCGKLTDGFVFLTNKFDNRLVFAVACSKAQVAMGNRAGDIAKLAAQMTGGNGGGRPEIAQAGGKDPAKLDEALKAVRAKLGIL
ncbi:MAG: alanine--tRNA ligase [Erysipelotrichales bacterium]|nr:alanine--tRNA ligase [Erysipelotrichales bacterium]